VAYHIRFSADGPRDRYTGTHGRSGLANAGTATRGPDGRVDTPRPCAHVHVHVHAHVQHIHVCYRRQWQRRKVSGCGRQSWRQRMRGRRRGRRLQRSREGVSLREVCASAGLPAVAAPAPDPGTDDRNGTDGRGGGARSCDWRSASGGADNGAKGGGGDGIVSGCVGGSRVGRRPQPLQLPPLKLQLLQEQRQRLSSGGQMTRGLAR